ncbi:hypothetical protein M409DRAFT_70181 [Zasmidium cellare ATCC 36951]|uniref:Gfo/Idh/MocA-like oxidoreductase N-terminal domain-containing protein n=1 Tax=Zasmidium cellare ATCC 36951 TaxID=1080233 RepID=A0A6A6C3M3_ZASCE|nr:uncharacterized protein M409DRAFT_70181 [Zasmidium cellare ATCC 36951]KAF2160888.1 hypothetical protein M409DRAFT_70181 [Zasmidium cellare ATCC 36951]
MAPIRIAFIGLSATGRWAARAHLPYLQKSSKYQITGICNSSKETGEAAIKFYELPSSVKAYGSVQELADDADSFDLAVCAVRVDKHFDAVKPIIAKGKQCFVEWPLGKNLQEAEELQAIALKSGNPRTLVGVQARRSPVVNKVKQLIADNIIGKVLSVTIRGAAGMSGAVEEEELGRLLNDKKIGASVFSIHFGHMIDFVLYALGQDVKSLNATVSTQRPTSQLKLADGSLEEVKRETPDHVLLQGKLANGALIDAALRGGPAFKDTPGFVWNIYGEKGEIEVSAPGVVLNVGFGPAVSVKLHDHQKDTVEVVDWKVDDENEKLPIPSQNVGRLYEAFAEGKKQEYADWEEAVERHRLLEKMVENTTKA